METERRGHSLPMMRRTLSWPSATSLAILSFLVACSAKVSIGGAPTDGGVGPSDASPGVIAGCTLGDDRSCDDAPGANQAVAGTCSADRTCACRASYERNPTTGRCRPSGGAVAARCTAPVDCNDDPQVSAIEGECVQGACVCNPGYVLRAATGKCGLGAVDASISTTCTPGMPQSCNPDPSISAIYGQCTSEGKCACNPGFENDPATGKCRVADGGSPLGPCTVASDCAGQWAPSAIPACAKSSYSCVVGTCTFECFGGRTCTKDAKGCLRCVDSTGGNATTSCPGTLCTEGLLQTDGGGSNVTMSTCQRAYLVDVVSCYGEMVTLRDGSICTLQSLMTNLPRAVLACGVCQLEVER